MNTLKAKKKRRTKKIREREAAKKITRQKKTNDLTTLRLKGCKIEFLNVPISVFQIVFLLAEKETSLLRSTLQLNYVKQDGPYLSIGLTHAY